MKDYILPETLDKFQVFRSVPVDPITSSPLPAFAPELFQYTLIGFIWRASRSSNFKRMDLEYDIVSNDPQRMTKITDENDTWNYCTIVHIKFTRRGHTSTLTQKHNRIGDQSPFMENWFKSRFSPHLTMFENGQAAEMKIEQNEIFVLFKISNDSYSLNTLYIP